MLKSFRELIVWQKAFAFATLVYRATEHFPANERYGLTSQLRRSAVSIVSNIAEGYGRATRKDYAHFLSNSLGSSTEAETQILLSRELKFLAEKQFQELISCLTEIQKMLTVMRRKLLIPLP